jgi:hypothetical protein
MFRLFSCVISVTAQKQPSVETDASKEAAHEDKTEQAHVVAAGFGRGYHRSFAATEPTGAAQLQI